MDVRQSTLLIREDEDDDKLFILMTGAMRVFWVKGNGQQVTVSHLSPGSVFGELATIANRRRTANVEASADSTVFAISKENLQEHSSRFHGFSNLIAAQLAARLIASNERLASYSNDDLVSHLLEILRSLGAVQTIAGTEEVVVPKRPTVRELSAELGVTRGEVFRLLAKLESDGMIVTVGKRVILRLIQ